MPRGFMSIALGAAALRSDHGWAHSFPARPVTLIVPYPAGTATDITLRSLASATQKHLGRSIVIENRPGGGGITAPAQMAASAMPDGYAISQIPLPVFRAPFLTKTTYDPSKDFTYIIGVTGYAYGVVVRADARWKNFPELLADAKANPGKINMATSGNGTPQHVAAELFTMMAGVDVLHVPYRSTTPALVDLLAGQVQVIFDTIPASIEFIRAGKLRPLGVTTTVPLDVLPGIPTVAEAVPGYEASAWQGVGAPKGTPAEIVDLLNKQINVALDDEKTKQRLIGLGAVPIPMSSADFAKMIAVETEKFAKVIKFANIKSE